jgi:N-dimethylarginine dimethylaminohydrolase
VLCVGPGRVIMPEGCPRLKAALERQGIRVAAEIRITQLLNAAGGIACASAPLSRQLSFGKH